MPQTRESTGAVPLTHAVAPQEYARRLCDRRDSLAACERRHGQLGNIRLLIFLAAIAMTYAALWRALFSGWWLLVPLAAFLWLGAQLQRAMNDKARLKRAVAFYERALARLEGRWAGTGETGERFLTDLHLYARDLDLFGNASVFQLLCAARTRMGEDVLASWLLEPAECDAVHARQKALVELGPKLDLREDLAVLGEEARSGVHPEALAAWGERQALLAPSPFRYIAWVLSCFGAVAAVAAIMYIGASIGIIQLPESTLTAMRLYFVFILFAFIPVLAYFKKRTERILSEAEAAAHDLSVLEGVLRRLESERFESPRLAELRAAIEIEGQPPSKRIGRLKKLLDLVDSRHNVFFQPIALLILFDLHLSYALEDWRRVSGPAMRRWLNAVGEMEALSSLAGYAYEHPRDVYPEWSDESSWFEGEALCHPLLKEDVAVANDVRIGGELRVLVVSGSNMSGKSTLLRTIGVNAVLAQAGAPVRAKRLRLSKLAVGASIRVQDSLQEGTSRFYAEIKRLRQIMEQASGPLPVLFLIDEFLHGTNSHDRRIGAEAITRGLVDRHAIGLITTHDLALAHIADSLAPRAANVHFEDHLEDGRMTFDHCMRPGIVEKSNALELMRSIGLEV